MPFRLARPQHVGERLRRVDDIDDGLAPARAQQVVGVLALRQQRELQALSGLEPRHRQIHRAIGRAQAGIVPVKTQDRLIRHFPEQPELVFRERRAERRDRRGKACRHHRDHIDVAFNDDDRRTIVRGLARGGNIVERCAFMKERRLRRVQIFRLRIFLQRAAAEGNDPAAKIADRKHHAIAEAIERHRNVVAGNQQAGFHHVLGRNAVRAEMLLQREAFARRVAKPEFQLRRRIEAAVGEIAACLRTHARGQRRFKKFRGDFHDVVQRLAPRIALLILARNFRQRHAGHLRQTFHGFGKADAFAFHHEIEDAAVLARGKIEPGLLLVVNKERRRLFFIERRQALELTARAHKLDAFAHDFRNRKPGLEFVEELGREAHMGFWPNRRLTANSSPYRGFKAR